MDIISAISNEEFMPHGYCLLWRPGLLWSSAAADILITLSYFSIPLALVWFIRKRTDFEHRWILVLFAAFIVLCGTTHLMGAVILWKPFYYLDVAVKIATAIVSVFTAVVIWPLIPKLLAMPSQSQLEFANAALKESEERYRGIFQSSNAVKLIIDPETLAIIDANNAACRFYGYGREKLLSMSMHEINVISPGETNKIREAAMAGKRDHFFFRHRLASGEIRDVESFPCVITLNGRKVIHAIIHDITARIAAEDALRQDEETFRALFNAITESVFIMDKSGVVLVMNETAAKRIGKRPEEVVGRNIISMIPEEVARRRMKVIEQVFESGEAAHLLDQRGGMWLDQTLYPVKDAAGHVTKLAIFAADVTDRKEVEGQLQEAMRELCDANEELREFVYIASHDLQEPLRKVTAFGDRLKKHLGPALDEKGADYLARMTSAAERMSRLIEDLLAFSRVTTRAKPFEPVDLRAVLEEVLEDLEVSISEAGAAVTAGSLPVIDADRTQMRQLLQNLIGNSLKFCPVKEPCRIAIRAALNDAGRELRGKQYAAGELLLISVEDNGIGFDEKYAERIFGVFQRLHGRGEYKGTGVGLAICKKIVERHNGGIEARSKLGEGSRFTVILPLRHKMREGR